MPAYTYDAKTVRFEGTFNQCSEQTIKLSQNYDCIGYPTTYTGLPYFHEREYTLQPIPATIQFDILSQPTSTVDTCSDYNVMLEARNAGEGDLTSPIITFDLPGDISSITIVDIAVEYPRNSGNIESLTPSLSGNTVTIDLLQHSFINAQNGLSGSYGASSLDEQIAIINMTLNPQCNYRSNTGTEYIITGNSPCGIAAIGSGSRLAIEPVIITGAEPPYSTNSVMISSPDLEGCEIETISVETYIVDGITGSNDFIRIVLPEGLIYVPNSFVSTGTATVTYLSTNSVGNHQEIEISLPVGANTTDLIAYNFGVESTENICQGTYDINLSTNVTTSGLNCGGVSCGTTEIVTGEVIAQINVTKSILEKSTFTATANYINEGTNTKYFITLGLLNTGGEDLSSGAEYNVFCTDAFGAKVGASIYTGTLTQAIPVGTSIEESFNFSSVNFCGINSNIIIEFEPSNSNCFCDALSILIPSTPSTDYADLEIEMSPNNNTVNVGDTVIFTITIENKGPLDATAVILENLIPSGYTFVSTDNSGTLSGNIITWPAFDLENNNTTTFSYTVTVNTQTTIATDFENIAQVIASDQPDSDSTPNNYDGLPLEDDEAISNIQFSISDLSIDKRLATGSTNTPSVGDRITFEIAITSDANATNISVADIVPVGFSADAASISNGGILTGSTITWTIPSIDTNTLIVSYDALVNTPTGVADEYKNIAQVTASDQIDPDSTPNNDDGDQSEDDEDAVNDILVATADLSIDKRLASGSTNTPNVGDVLNFEIIINNNGPHTATNISIEDYIPIGFTVDVTSISNSGILLGSTITWNITSLPVGNIILNYAVNVNTPTGITDEYKNIVQVTAVDQYDPDSTPNNDDGDQSEDDEDAYNTMVTQPFVDIDITKTANVLEATLGDTVVFTITAQNLGNTLATNIVIDEKIPNGFELVSSNTLNGIYDLVLGEWTIPSMNINESSTLTITVLVVKGENYTNIATLSYLDQIDTNTDNDEDEVTIDFKEDCLIIYNEFSPNNDGANEFFFIECIDQYPNSYLEIFNRWGTKVYEKKGYDNTWDGTSTGRATLKANEKLPVGTYYYSLDLGDGKTAPKAGWLYLNR